MDILDVFVRYMIPITAGCALVVVTVNYGLGKCLKIAGAAIYSVGDGIEVALEQGRRTARRTFAEAKENIL